MNEEDVHPIIAAVTPRNLEEADVIQRGLSALQSDYPRHQFDWHACEQVLSRVKGAVKQMAGTPLFGPNFKTLEGQRLALDGAAGYDKAKHSFLSVDSYTAAGYALQERFKMSALLGRDWHLCPVYGQYASILGASKALAAVVTCISSDGYEIELIPYGGSVVVAQKRSDGSYEAPGKLQVILGYQASTR